MDEIAADMFETETESDTGPNAEPVDAGAETMRLACKLSHDERIERVQQLADRLIEQGHVEAEKKQAIEDFKAKLKAIDSRVGELIEAVKTGIEYRPVQVEERADSGRRVVETVRLDTGDVVSTRTMDDEDRQVSLPGTEHVAVDTDGIERVLTEAQARRLRSAIEKGKPCMLDVDGAKIRLVRFRDEAPDGQLELTGPRTPPRAPKRPHEHAVDVGGEVWVISAEQADVVRAAIAGGGQSHAVVEVPGEGPKAIVALQACEQCGAADGNHRLEGHLDEGDDAELDDAEAIDRDVAPIMELSTIEALNQQMLDALPEALGGKRRRKSKRASAAAEA